MLSKDYVKKAIENALGIGYVVTVDEYIGQLPLYTQDNTRVFKFYVGKLSVRNQSEEFVIRFKASGYNTITGFASDGSERFYNTLIPYETFESVLGTSNIILDGIFKCIGDPDGIGDDVFIDAETGDTETNDNQMPHLFQGYKVSVASIQPYTSPVSSVVLARDGAAVTVTFNVDSEQAEGDRYQVAEYRLYRGNSHGTNFVEVDSIGPQGEPTEDLELQDEITEGFYTYKLVIRDIQDFEDVVFYQTLYWDGSPA